MKTVDKVTRRAFLAASAAAPLALAAKSHIPVGLELYSVREQLKTDTMGTLDAVAKMGYKCVEFYAPYYDWTPAYAKEVRGHLDSLGLKCHSTHNSIHSFSPSGIGKAIELNGILGTRYVVCASPGKVTTIDDWKAVAGLLNTANDSMQKAKLHTGYHNHQLEWKPVDGQVPMELLAAQTEKTVLLQLDVGTCVEMKRDPVAWINANPGRIRALHLKEWSPDTGYKALFGEGVAPWKEIFAAAEKKGGVEFYLIEQEGSRFPELETASRCLANYKELRKT
jgi:sugar phosphate isomerase/epimerase